MTTATKTKLDDTHDEVTDAEELAAAAKKSGDDDPAVAVEQAVGSHNTIDTSTAPTIDVTRAGIRSLLIAWDGVEAVHGHGYYEAQIDTDSAFGSPDDFYKGKATYAVFDGLTTGATYYARVRAVDAAGNTGPWSGSTGAQTTDETDTGDIADDAVTTVKIEDLAVTDAKIKTLTAGKVTAGTISGEEIVVAGGTSGILRSGNFSAGSTGWRIRGNGDAEFNDVTVRGVLESGAVTVDTTFFGGNVRFDGGSDFSGDGGGGYLASENVTSTDQRFSVFGPKNDFYAGRSQIFIEEFRGSGGDSAIVLDAVDHISLESTTLGVFSATGASKQTVSGSRGGNAALQSLLTALAAYGLITDSTT